VRAGVLYPRYWDDPRLGIARRLAPVAGVSWYEANAYCRWLASRRELAEWAALARLAAGELEVRLSTEAEWVEAGGGEEGGRFAWGRLEDPEKEILRYANTAESGIGRTTPVWMYPQGASPRGVRDLSGNVWEWQANYYDKDHDLLGLRGGSWSLRWDFARVAVRFDLPPYGLWDYLGFRLVALPL
jgi:formylglycine-generating enzyme required for sulfatase activity